MQIVAKFQFSAPTNDQVVADQIAEVIREWGRTKFEQDAAGSTLIRRSGVAAIFDTQRQISGSSTETTFNVLEPVSGGQLQTQIRILETASRAHVRCTLSLRSDGGVLLPYVAIRSPKFICDIIKLDKQWQVAEEAERIFAKCFGVRSKEEVETLWRLITATQRRLPVIVVSELQGETLGNDIHELISTDVCAIAHTCRLSTESSWELTNVCGKEWSCYNGAIRLYWPFRLNRDDYRVHPLWTRDFLMRGTDEEKFARDRFRMELAQRLIEASTFTPDNPAFANFEAERVRSAREAERAKAAGDFKVLAESYATENDDLRAALATSNNELETLRQNISR